MHRLFELNGTKLIAWSPPVPLATVRHFNDCMLIASVIAWSPPVPLAAVRHFKIAGLFARLFSRA